MTEPRDQHHDRQTNATTNDGEPEVRPEVIQDLDPQGADDVIRGGCFHSAGYEPLAPGQAT
jgi:hypothetical protein